MRGRSQINSRRFQKRIEIFKLIPDSDGFGGTTLSEISIGTFWADFRSLSSGSKTISNLQALGLTDFSQLFIVTLRSNVLNQKIEETRIKYNDVIYDIISVQDVDDRNIRTNLIVKEHKSGS